MDIESQFMPSSYDPQFVSRVYAVVCYQLSITMVFVLSACYSEPFQKFMIDTLWFVWVCFAVVIVTMLWVLIMTPPFWISFVLMTIFTCADSYVLGFVSSFYETDGVLQALLLTLVITVTLTVFTFWSGIDFSFAKACLTGCLLVLVLFGFLRLIFPFSPLATTGWAVFGAAVFSGWIVVDTSDLQAKYQQENQYIVAAMSLYLDITRLFIKLLELVANLKK